MFLKIHPKGNERKFSILSTVYKFITIISAVRLHERKKPFANMSFCLEKAVVNVLFLLHGAEKLFVQITIPIIRWHYIRSPQRVHFQFLVPYLMCLWGKWEVFQGVNTYLRSTQCVRAVWKEGKGHKETCKLRRFKQTKLLNNLDSANSSLLTIKQTDLQCELIAQLFKNNV